MQNSLPPLQDAQTLLTLCAMKIVQLGQGMIQQHLSKIEQAVETHTDETLEEAFQLYELNTQTTIELPPKQIDKWLAGTKVNQQPYIQEIRKLVQEYKIYLLLVRLLNNAVTHNPTAKEGETLEHVERNLSTILTNYNSQIEQSIILQKSLKSLLKCLQQLKLIHNFSSNLKDEDQVAKLKAQLKAFKILKNSPKAVMSKHWLKEIIEKHSASGKASLFNKLAITETGFLRFNRLIEAAFNDQKEPINEEDLALMGLMFGPAAVKRVMRHYGLVGNGTRELPFTINNLKALLIGLAANLRTDELAQLAPKAKEALAQVESCFEEKVKLGETTFLKELLDEYENEQQNKVPYSLYATTGHFFYKQLKNIISNLRNYFQNLLIANLNVIGSERVKEYGEKLLKEINLPNLPLQELQEDINFLQTRAQINPFIFNVPSQELVHSKVDELFHDLQRMSLRKFGLKYKEYRSENLTSQEKNTLYAYHLRYSKGESGSDLDELTERVKSIFLANINPWDKYIDEIILDLKSLDFERFLNKYPAFKEENLSSTHYHALKAANRGINAANREAQDARIQIAREVILNKIKEIFPFARATLFSHVLAYSQGLYNEDKKDTLFTLPLITGQEENFALKPVIHDENGMACALMSPQSEAVNSETIPLYVVFEGTHDLYSLLRDLHPGGAGLDEFNPAKPYLNRILNAINTEIAQLTAKYPNKKVSIEIFGHSLAGADTYQLLLALQEAMAQNKAREPKGYQDYVELCSRRNRNGFHFAKRKSLRESLPLALKESLGLLPRDFGHAHVESRVFKQEDISALNLANIDHIKVFSKNGAGCHKKVLSALAATAAFLGLNSDYTVHDYPSDIDGDLVGRTGHGRGLYLADPREVFFKDTVKMAHCKLDTSKGGLLNQGLHLLNGRLAPLDAHQGVVFEQGPVSWLQQDAKIIHNTSRKNNRYLKQALTNPFKIGPQLVVDYPAYRKAKAVVHSTLYLTATLLAPILRLFSLIMRLMLKVKVSLANLCGVSQPMPHETKEEAKLLREHAIDEQKQLLFSKSLKAKSATTDMRKTSLKLRTPSKPRW